ncbi:MAG: efflux RND transporter periplasmic adaptor subunit, partial [Acidobacteria bacterium]|nr:efflux RND transporter periplasmic adaptor subunit [Acidobacteriota bacterium]
MKLLSLASALLLLAACGRDSDGAKPATAAAAEPSSAALADPMEITPSQQLRATLKTGEPVMAEVGATITVAARIEVDETRVTRISSPVMGRITALMAREGQDVSKGELLAQLNSTGLSDAQLGFLKALSQKMLAQRAVERAQQLLKAEVIGSAELQRREAEFTQSSAELDGARDQLELLGMAPDAIEELQRTRSIRSVSRVVASMEGTVLARKVTVGQVVQAADTIFEIADLSHVWLIADVPESNA